MRPISLKLQFFTVAVFALAVCVAVVLADRIPWREWPQLLLYLSLLVTAYSLRVPDPRGASFTPSAVLTYLAMYIFNPPTALLLAGAGRTIGDIMSRGWVPWRALFNGAQLGLSVALGAVIFGMLGGSPERVGETTTYLALIAAPFAYQVANHFFVGYPVSQWRGTPFLGTWFNGIRYLFWQNLLSIPTAIVLGILYIKVHYSAVLVYLVLLPFQWMALRLYVKRRQLYAQIVDGLVVATDVNFPLGRGHARRVADLAESIAREMRLGEPEVESIQFAALLHDVGMIGKDDVLERPVLTPEDTEALRNHVRVGAEIAKELPRKEIAALILSHHERYDGGGYPNGLRAGAIPLGSRIIALAETVESMASGTFPFASALPFESIVSYVSTEAGQSFDPEVVHAFLRATERGSQAIEADDREDDLGHPPRPGEQPAR